MTLEYWKSKYWASRPHHNLDSMVKEIQKKTPALSVDLEQKPEGPRKANRKKINCNQIMTL